VEKEADKRTDQVTVRILRVISICAFCKPKRMQGEGRGRLERLDSHRTTGWTRRETIWQTMSKIAGPWEVDESRLQNSALSTALRRGITATTGVRLVSHDPMLPFDIRQASSLLRARPRGAIRTTSRTTTVGF
jgi:hypothetical protein